MPRGDVGYLFLVGSSIFLLMAVQQLVEILVFSQEEMSTHPSTPHLELDSLTALFNILLKTLAKKSDKIKQ